MDARIDYNGVFPKWSSTFIEFIDFSDYRESDIEQGVASSTPQEKYSDFQTLSFHCILEINTEVEAIQHASFTVSH